MKKFILTLIFSLFVGFLTFCNAEDYYTDGGDISIYSNGTYNFNPGFCANSTTIFGDLTFYYSDGTLLINGSDIPTNNYVCFYVSGYVYNNRSSIRVLKGFNIYDFGFNCPVGETCPEVDTGSILSGYIAIQDITTNYCTSNDLCPEMSGGNSAIYINDIRHESMPFINIRIPEEIQRDYEYTGNNTQLDISIEGYGYDAEKMQNMINTQYYTPTSEEMSNLIGKIAEFLPLVAIALLIVRIRRVLKKVFKF